MHPNVHHSTIIYNSHDMEATEMFISRRMVKEDVYIHSMEYYSAIKRYEIMPFTGTRMDLDYHTKWNNTEKDKYDITHMWNLVLKKGDKWTYVFVQYTNVQNGNRLSKTNLWLPKGKRGGQG